MLTAKSIRQLEPFKTSGSGQHTATPSDIAHASHADDESDYFEDDENEILDLNEAQQLQDPLSGIDGVEDKSINDILVNLTKKHPPLTYHQ